MAPVVAAYNTPRYWSTSSSPLSVSGYGSTAKAYGYSKALNASGGMRLYSYAWNSFRDGDNHALYITGASYFNGGTCSSCGDWVRTHGYTTSGLNYTNSSWTAMATKSFPADTAADAGYLTAQVGIDVPWRTDPRSAQVSSRADGW
jgi:hypothetical protein